MADPRDGTTAMEIGIEDRGSIRIAPRVSATPLPSGGALRAREGSARTGGMGSSMELLTSLSPASEAVPIARVALFLAVILLVAKLGGDLARRIKQPAVLGELVGGMVLGNLALVGVPGVEA